MPYFLPSKDRIYCVRLHTNALGPFSVWGPLSGGKQGMTRWITQCCVSLKFATFVGLGLTWNDQRWMETWTPHSCGGLTFTCTFSVSNAVSLDDIRKFMQHHWLQHILSKYPSVHTPFNARWFAPLVDVDEASVISNQLQYPCNRSLVLPLNDHTAWALHQQCLMGAGLSAGVQLKGRLLTKTHPLNPIVDQTKHGSCRILQTNLHGGVDAKEPRSTEGDTSLQAILCSEQLLSI
jgi:hypothetical protein